MKENIGQLSNEQTNYEYKKMIHTLSSGKPLLRRGVFRRIFELLGAYSGKLQADPIKDSKFYDRCVQLGYMHIGCIFNKEVKTAFDRYLIDYKVVPTRTSDHRGKTTNYGNITIYFKWENVQWGLMDSDLKEKYPNAYKIDKRGCVSLDTYKVRKHRIKLKNIRNFASNDNVPLKWSDIVTNNVSTSPHVETPVDNENEFLFVELEDSTLKRNGIKRSKFEELGIKIINSFNKKYQKYHRFEVKNLALWNEAKVKYNLITE